MTNGHDPRSGLITHPRETIGHVLGREDATPLEFWVALAPATSSS